jgi:hypothetical protein
MIFLEMTKLVALGGAGQNFKEREDSEYRAGEANNDVQQSCFLNTSRLTVS